MKVPEAVSQMGSEATNARIAGGSETPRTAASLGRKRNPISMPGRIEGDSFAAVINAYRRPSGYEAARIMPEL